MTDEEVRGRLARLRRGDPVVNGIANLNVLQLLAFYLLPGTGTDFRSVCAYVVIVFLIASWIFKVVRRRRDAASEPDAVRSLYEALLSKSIEGIRKMPEEVSWGLGAVGLVMGGFVLFSNFGDRPLGAAISLLNVLMAVQMTYQWRRVLPRLEREQAESLMEAPA